MSEFSFISDDVLRSMLERDRKELEQCLENRVCKATLLLAGSIIEAVLFDYFLEFPPQGKSRNQILNDPRLALGRLIGWAAQESLISEKTKGFSTVVQGYRNLIHPGRELREQESFDITDARVAASLVDRILREVAENYAERLGYSAEQAIEKVRIDPSSPAIFPHVIDSMARPERIKLFRLIPAECSQGNMADDQIERFVAFHGLLGQQIPYKVVEIETARTYDYVRSRTPTEVLSQLRFFYDRLDLLQDDQLDAVVTYLLGILGAGDGESLEALKRCKIHRCSRYLRDSRREVNLWTTIPKRLDRSPDNDDLFLSVLKDIVGEFWDEDTHVDLEHALRGHYGGKGVRAKAWIEVMNNEWPVEEWFDALMEGSMEAYDQMMAERAEDLRRP